MQLAVTLGADVTTTVRSDAARDFAITLGRHHVIDTRIQPFDDLDACYDVVIDTVGGETLDRSFEIICPGGTLVTLSAPPAAREGRRLRNRRHVLHRRARSGRTHRLLRSMSTTTRLHVAIAGTYPLADGRAAFESGRQSGRRPGKTVLTVRN